MKFVTDAKQAWKWFSVWAMGVPASLAATWLLIPDEWRGLFLVNVTSTQIVWAVLVVMALGIFGRLVKQSE
jgi:hypothetical protein